MNSVTQDIALQVLIEIVCSIVAFDSANCAVKVVQVLVGIFRAAAGIRYKLLDDIRSVKDIVVNFRCRPLLNPDAIVVVLVAVGSECLQLASLFPSQRMTEVMSRVALRIVGNCLPVVCGQQIFPTLLGLLYYDQTKLNVALSVFHSGKSNGVSKKSSVTFASNPSSCNVSVTRISSEQVFSANWFVNPFSIETA